MIATPYLGKFELLLVLFLQVMPMERPHSMSDKGDTCRAVLYSAIETHYLVVRLISELLLVVLYRRD